MEPNLLRELLKKSIVGPDCEIDARYIGLDMAGTPLVSTRGNFVIRNITDTGSSIYLNVADTVSGTPRRIRHDAIDLIEGMLPERLAETYGIGEDGGPLKAASRRGRKPRPSMIDPDDEDVDDEGLLDGISHTRH